MRLALAALVLLCLSCQPAAAHDAPSGWHYPQECCSDRDCAPLDASRVREVPRGYLIDGEFTVLHAATKDSPDGEYHACFVPGVKQAPRCFWRPKPSF